MQTVRHPLLGQSLGTARELVSLHYGTTGRGPKVTIQASLHADELPGMLVAHHLRRRLDVLEAEGKVLGEIVLVPLANPIGLSQWVLREPLGRFDLASGENFNRHYPELLETVWWQVESLLGADASHNVAIVRAALRGAIGALPVRTELESLRRTLLLLAADADIVLDLHCDCEAVMHLYTGTALWPDVEPLARLLGAEASLLAEESGDRPFDEACSQLWWQLAQRAGTRRPVPPACAAVTVELRGLVDIDHALAAGDAQALLDYLAMRGVLDLPTAPLPALRQPATPLAGSIPVETPASGVIVWLRAPGDIVQRDDPVAEIVDPLTDTVTVLGSPATGLLYARELRRFATAGMRLAKVAGTEALRSGKLLSA